VGAHAFLGNNAAVTRDVPPYVMAVGLFVNAKATEIRAILKEVPLGLLQFQGDEDAAFCSKFGVPYVRAVRMSATTRWMIRAPCSARTCASPAPE